MKTKLEAPPRGLWLLASLVSLALPIFCGCNNDCDCTDSRPAPQRPACAEAQPHHAGNQEEVERLKRDIEAQHNRLNASRSDHVVSLDDLKRRLGRLNSGYVALTQRSTDELVAYREDLRNWRGVERFDKRSNLIALVNGILLLRVEPDWTRAEVHRVLGDPEFSETGVDYFPFDDCPLELDFKLSLDPNRAQKVWSEKFHRVYYQDDRVLKTVPARQNGLLTSSASPRENIGAQQ